MYSFVAENGNLKTSGSAVVVGYAAAASIPMWLVQTGLGPSANGESRCVDGRAGLPSAAMFTWADTCR
jgi:hypothetical protein